MICDNIPGLVNKQRQMCQRHPDIMQAIGVGTKEWIKECQHQLRHHRWNCSTLDRDQTVFGRVLQRSKFTCVFTSSIQNVCLITDCMVNSMDTEHHLLPSRSSFLPLLLYFYCLISNFSPSLCYFSNRSFLLSRMLLFIVTNGLL